MSFRRRQSGRFAAFLSLAAAALIVAEAQAANGAADGTSESLWFRKGQSPQVLPRGQTCENYGFPEYGEGTANGCGMRILPIKLTGTSRPRCEVLSFASISTDIVRMEPIQANRTQNPHVYLGVGFRKNPPKAQGCALDGFYELGIQSQSVVNQVPTSAIYLRGSPERGERRSVMDRLTRDKSFKAGFGLKAMTLDGRMIQNKSVQINDQGYILENPGGDPANETFPPRGSMPSRFDASKPTRLEAGFFADKAAFGKWSIRMRVKITGKCSSQVTASGCYPPNDTISDFIEVDAGTASGASADIALQKYLSNCVEHQRITLDGPVGRVPEGAKGENGGTLKRTNARGEPIKLEPIDNVDWKPFDFALSSTHFKGASGADIGGMNALLAQTAEMTRVYPRANGLDCVRAELGLPGFGTLKHTVAASNRARGRRADASHCVDCAERVYTDAASGAPRLVEDLDAVLDPS